MQFPWIPDLPQHSMLRRVLLLRALALGAQLIGVGLAQLWLGVNLPLLPLAVILLCNVLSMIWTGWRLQSSVPVGEWGLFAQLLADVMNWSALLYFCGGATNPFVSFLLAILALAAAMLPPRLVVLLAVIALAAYSLLNHYYQPLELASSEQAITYHLAGMWVNFVLSSLVIAGFVARISSALRERDAQLAQARERQLQNAQLLALGTQAASAAHALATPLSTFAVLLGELRDQAGPGQALHPYLEDLQLMEKQMEACQATLKAMRRQPGSDQAYLHDWLPEYVQNWRLQYPQVECSLHLGAAPRLHLRDLQAQAQILQTLLDNARAVSERIEISVHEANGRYWLQVRDEGPGIDPDLLARLGHAPVASSSGGQGIGLWLACASARQIGIELEFSRPETGGTCARLSLALV